MSCRQPLAESETRLSVAPTGACDASSPSDPGSEIRRAFALVERGLAESERRLNTTTFAVGELVGGRYLVERFLARGGMGEIYLVLDQLLEARVALKTLFSVVADDPSAVGRLLDELRLSRRVTHPNVCRTFDAAVHADDPRDIVHFVTMELLEGETLAARSRRQRWTLEEALHITRQILQGLDAVHTAGVLHRDVKSQNIIIEESGAKLRAVLLDFGLARLLDGRRRASGIPSSGSLVYMAPEQMGGRELSPATDLFSVGVLLFEMCTGHLPFERPGDQLRRSRLERLFASERWSALPQGLDGFLARCLAYSPSARYPDAPAALAALAQLSGRSSQQPTANCGP